MTDYWVPQTKSQLIVWLLNYYPKGKKSLARLTKKQLYAIFYKETRKQRLATGV
jgi:hypothetical protein